MSILRPDRRTVMAGLAGAALMGPQAGFAQTSPVEPAPTQTGLIRAAAAKRGILFGSAFDEFVRWDDEYATLLRNECAILSTDYNLKFGAIRPEKNETDFRGADILFAFADELGVPIRGHNLIWNDWMPDWTKRLSRKDISLLLDRHIDEVAGRYAGRVHSWDVVNEPIWRDSGNPGGLRGGPWFDALGPGHIERAFRRAKKADPKAKLILNESGMELPNWGRPVSADLLRIAENLLHAGAPIDGIGIESHLQPPAYDPEGFLSFLEKVQGMGLDIYITELDVDDRALPDDVETRDHMVAEFYERFLRDVLKFSAVKVIVTWELSDRHTWYPGNVREKPPSGKRAPRPLPFDTEMKRKPAYDAILRALS